MDTNSPAIITDHFSLSFLFLRVLLTTRCFSMNIGRPAVVRKTCSILPGCAAHHQPHLLPHTIDRYHPVIVHAACPRKPCNKTETAGKFISSPLGYQKVRLGSMFCSVRVIIVWTFKIILAKHSFLLTQRFTKQLIYIA